MRTIERFYQFNRDLNFIIVLPQSQQAYWRSLCAEHHFTISHTVVNGGDTRFASSKNGLSCIPDDAQGLVAIHDGVRPFVSVDVIDRCFNEARTSGTAIPVVPAIDSLRQIDTLARKAFNQPYSDKFTDDASVIEGLGIKINTVEGNRENIKLTTPFDLKIAEVIAED